MVFIRTQLECVWTWISFSVHSLLLILEVSNKKWNHLTIITGFLFLLKKKQKITLTCFFQLGLDLDTYIFHVFKFEFDRINLPNTISSFKLMRKRESFGRVKYIASRFLVCCLFVNVFFMVDVLVDTAGGNWLNSWSQTRSLETSKKVTNHRLISLRILNNRLEMEKQQSSQSNTELIGQVTIQQKVGIT